MKQRFLPHVFYFIVCAFVCCPSFVSAMQNSRPQEQQLKMYYFLLQQHMRQQPLSFQHYRQKAMSVKEINQKLKQDWPVISPVIRAPWHTGKGPAYYLSVQPQQNYKKFLNGANN